MTFKEFVLTREEHPLKKQIQVKGIPFIHIANYLGVHYSLISMYMNGHRKMPDELEEKIKAIINES